MDLQHLHLKEYFSEGEIHARETLYRTFCRQARTVIAISEWGRRDLITSYGLSADKVSTVLIGGPVNHIPAPTPQAVEECRRHYRLPAEFILFPAQTMPHKNHIGLLEGLASIRERHATVPPLVCCGHQTDHFAVIRKRVRELGLQATCHFPGAVSFQELRCLYQMCKLVAFPTRFEGFGIPIFEAFTHGAPLACSNVACLAEVAGDAALLFDPCSPGAIGEAVGRLWTDEMLRKELVRRGRRRVKEFTWERMAKLFRAHYRRVANRALTEEDRGLLAASAVA